jgi:hypothetical protein
MYEMQQYLITTDEVSALSRGMSVHLDPDKIETYIRESENIYIKSALGDELFLEREKKILKNTSYCLTEVLMKLNVKRR